MHEVSRGAQNSREVLCLEGDQGQHSPPPPPPHLLLRADGAAL